MLFSRQVNAIPYGMDRRKKHASPYVALRAKVLGRHGRVPTIALSTLGLAGLLLSAACNLSGFGNNLKNEPVACQNTVTATHDGHEYAFCVDDQDAVSAIPHGMRKLCELDVASDQEGEPACDAQTWPPAFAAKFFGPNRCPIGTVPSENNAHCCTGGGDGRLCYGHRKHDAQPRAAGNTNGAQP